MTKTYNCISLRVANSKGLLKLDHMKQDSTLCQVMECHWLIPSSLDQSVTLTWTKCSEEKERVYYRYQALRRRKPLIKYTTTIKKRLQWSLSPRTFASERRTDGKTCIVFSECRKISTNLGIQLKALLTHLKFIMHKGLNLSRSINKEALIK